VLVGVGLAAAGLAAPAQAAGPRVAAARHTTVASVKTPLGRVVSSKRGHVMFRFMKDGRNSSACRTACHGVWPPVMSTTAAKAGSHISARHLGRTSAGQVTYSHHPLYFYVGDPRVGKTKGDGISEFGAKWFVVSTSGKPVKPAAGGGGGGGGGYTPVVPDAAPTINARMEGSTTTAAVLSDSAGFALYALATESSSTVVCTEINHCVPAWTPVLTDAADDAAAAGTNVTQAKLSTVSRTFGTTTAYQVTYNDRPLYTYNLDTAANQDNGQWKSTAGHFWGTVFPDTGDINQAIQP
jgi:predicted lipoprotein with Yx(FWY)xxD motif